MSLVLVYLGNEQSITTKVKCQNYISSYSELKLDTRAWVNHKSTLMPCGLGELQKNKTYLLFWTYEPLNSKAAIYAAADENLSMMRINLNNCIYHAHLTEHKMKTAHKFYNNHNKSLRLKL